MPLGSTMSGRRGGSPAATAVTSPAVTVTWPGARTGGPATAVITRGAVISISGAACGSPADRRPHRRAASPPAGALAAGLAAANSCRISLATRPGRSIIAT